MTTATASNGELAPARYSRVPLWLAGLVVAATSLAATGGGTAPRLLLAVSLPILLGAWMHPIRRPRPRVLSVIVLTLLGVVGSAHVGMTSPAAAWVVDSHMVPQFEALLPPGGVRLVMAWSVPLLWAAAFVAVAVEARDRTESSHVALLPLAAGIAPLAVDTAFPTDAYRLLWDSTAFGHAAYAVGACLVVAFVMWLPDGTKPGSEIRGDRTFRA